MFSVVIPTMWRVTEFLNDLKNLDECSLVGEIILVNNNLSQTPDEFCPSNYSKLIEVNAGKNLFINASWNLGIRMAKYYKVCIKNDDIFFPNYEQTFSAILPELNSDDCLIGMGIKHSNGKIEQQHETSIHFNEVKEIVNGFGCCMFLNKEDFIPINERINIWYGDNFMIDSYVRRDLKVKTVHGLNSNGYISATVDHVPEIIKLKHEDERLWNSEKETLFKECGL